MKIAILTAKMPFLYGGAEFLADSLKDKLIEFGYEAQVIGFHYSYQSVQNVMDGMLAASCMRIANVDHTISLVFPAYLIPHASKKLWLLHQFRQAYDMEGTRYDCFSQSAQDQAVKSVIRKTDTSCLMALEGKIYTNSNVVSKRLLKYNGVRSEVLYPPLMDANLYSTGDFGDYIFYPSRVNRSKRQDLAVKALAKSKSNVRLILAGKGDTSEDEEFIFETIEKCGVGDRVTYINRFITQQEKADLFKNSLGCIYIPYNEDSYGYVTLEAIQSEKPIISCTDAGGTDVVVKDGYTGFMTEPTAEALGEAMDKLYLNKSAAKEMGGNGLALLHELNINWENVIRRLVV